MSPSYSNVKISEPQSESVESTVVSKGDDRRNSWTTATTRSLQQWRFKWELVIIETLSLIGSD